MAPGGPQDGGIARCCQQPRADDGEEIAIGGAFFRELSPEDAGLQPQLGGGRIECRISSRLFDERAPHLGRERPAMADFVQELVTSPARHRVRARIGKCNRAIDLRQLKSIRIVMLTEEASAAEQVFVGCRVRRLPVDERGA